jgi:hypothetical protein
MSERVFIFYNLKPDVDRARFDERARSVERPLAESLEAIERYSLTRFSRTEAGDAPPPFEYVEVLDVSSVKEYSAISSPAVDEFLAEWESDVTAYVMAYGASVADTETPVDASTAGETDRRGGRGEDVNG